jgi:hypothetical protein
VQSVGAALVLCAGLTRFGRHGEAAWGGQEDTGGTRAAFRAGGRQLAFRHWPQLCERPALLAHIFIRRHRPPASGRNASCADRSFAIVGNYTSRQPGCERQSVANTVKCVDGAPLKSRRQELVLPFGTVPTPLMARGASSLHDTASIGGHADTPGAALTRRE